MSETQKYLTISALTAYLKRKFDADPYLQKVYVTGEIFIWAVGVAGIFTFQLKIQVGVP